MKQTLVVILTAITALAAGIWLQSRTSLKPEIISSELPTYRLPDLTDSERSFSEWYDKIVIVNYWATWCPPCREEIPEFVALQQEFQDRGLQFVGIAIEDKAAVLDYLDFVEINYPILIAGEQGILLTQPWGNPSGVLPFSVIFNRQGQVIHKQPGRLSRAEILALIEPLIN